MKVPVIIFTNQKGGVGKTTLTRELGIYLSSLGNRVLLVDCDPQGNLTKSLLDDEPEGPGLYDALCDSDAGLMELKENLFLLKGDFRLALLEKTLIGEIDAYTRLKALFRREDFSGFSCILLDTRAFCDKNANGTMKTIRSVRIIRYIFAGSNMLTPKKRIILCDEYYVRSKFRIRPVVQFLTKIDHINYFIPGIINKI